MLLPFVLPGGFLAHVQPAVKREIRPGCEGRFVTRKPRDDCEGVPEAVVLGATLEVTDTLSVPIHLV
jgi:hypothetical protein